MLMSLKLFRFNLNKAVSSKVCLYNLNLTLPPVDYSFQYAPFTNEGSSPSQ